MSLCILAAGKVTTLAATAFTLMWTHSIERVEWQEDWRLSERGLEIVEARIKGSGAGMEPPDGAVLEGDWWRYKPKLAPLKELRLAASGATQSGWRLCTSETCLTLGAETNPDGISVARCTGVDEQGAQAHPPARPR